MESKEEETAEVVAVDEKESTDITKERDEETMENLPEVVRGAEDIDDVISFRPKTKSHQKMLTSSFFFKNF